MDFKTLEAELKKLTPREHHYQKHHELSDYYEQLDQQKINGELVYVFNNLIPKNQSFQIIKHTRFIPVPYHIHNFIELNYIYSGKCTQIINGKKVTLKKGQICLIDTAVPHSIEDTGIDDIIINLLVNKDYFTKQLSRENFDEGIVLDFVLTALSDKHSHDQYIVFKNSLDTQIRLTIQEMLLENFSSLIGNQRIIENLIAILFTLLVRDFDYETNKTSTTGKEQILEILHYIEENYMNVTLSNLAKIFNYTPAYLSSLIRKETSKNFSQLVIDKKLERANFLVKHTAKPITLCASEAGFTNITFFYKKYQERYGSKPSNERKSAYTK